MERLQNESAQDYKFRVLIDKAKGELDVSWKEINESLGLGLNPDTIRKGTFFLPEYADYVQLKSDVNAESYNYKQTTEISSDGSQKSDKIIAMTDDQSKDVDYLLTSHGFDKSVWELTSAKNSIWNVNTKLDGIKTLYSSKISVKPKNNGFDIDKFVESVNKDVKQIIIDSPTESEDKLLEIPLFDMHWGIADLEYYKPTYDRIQKRIRSEKWDKILFVIGQDLLHNDGFTGKTTAGTIIDKVDIHQAWNDADAFYTSLIKEALLNSKSINIIFSNGNHDQALGYAFVRMLEAKFPQVEFDTIMKQRKGFVWNKVFIATTHGDKGHARMVRNVLDEFRNEILASTVAEIHSGHLHSEKSKDDFGIVSRTLGTGAKTDDWHYTEGFTGSMKRFQLFEYSSDSLDGVYYV